MHSLRVLEFSAITDRLRAQCETPIGAAFAEELQPTFMAEEVWEALELTKEAHDALGRHSPPNLSKLRDPRRNLELAAKGSILPGVDLYRIAEAMAVIRSLRGFLDARKQDYPKLARYLDSLVENSKLEYHLLQSLESDGTVRDEASAALQSLRSKKKSLQQRIQERIQTYISGRSRDLLSDPIFTVRDGRYVLPVKAENRGKIRGIVHDSSASGQTIYVEPEDVLQLGNSLRELEAAEREEVQRLLAQWSKQVGAVSDDLIGGVETASLVDFAFSKARLGYDMKASFPERAEQLFTIEIFQARHPLLDPDKVVPVDIKVGKDRNVLITGPNTGGKTVAIKCVGLFVLMAQCGLMVPALQVVLSPFTQVWADIGDEQSLEQSLSTFSGHLKNIAEALKQLRPGSLVLLDEVGSGTDPAEGAALARAILSAFAEGGAALLASTHYGELKAFAFSQPGFTNAAMEFDSKSLRPTYKLLMGAPGASQAMRIAEKYGISPDIVEKARGYLSEESQDIGEMFARLETAQKIARSTQSEADRRLAELRKSEQRAQKKLAEAEEIRKNVHSKANEIIESALREIRLEASRLFEELKSSPNDSRLVGKVREDLRELDAVGRDFAREFLPHEKKRSPVHVEKGVHVKVEGFTRVGMVLTEPKDGAVTVQMGSVKMTVPVSRLELSAPPRESLAKPSSNIRLQKAIHATTEIDVRHQRAEEAIRNVEQFIDSAVLAGLNSVRVVHGKGEGVLRKATQDLLKNHPAVSGVRDGEPAEGGQGATVVTLA